MADTKRTVIVGAGVAGVSAAAGMRTAGYAGEIVLIGDEPELPYRRPPVSKEIISGERTADQIRIKKAEWYADKRIELLTGVHVTSIDPAAKTVHVAAGGGAETPWAYDQLLLATGGRARTMPGASGVHTLRSLADVPALIAEMQPGKHVIVVGAGLIGSEIAASARGLGCQVTLLEAAGLPLPRLLPRVIGQMYCDLHKSEGTELHTDVDVEAIAGSSGSAGSGGVTVVTAADGRSWSAPVVVLAIGMEPNTELAEAAGIAVDNGITVDALGQTSIPNIYAAGDVANQPNGTLGGRQRVEHWQGAQHHGTAVGKAMAGSGVEFAEVPWCWSDQYGSNLQVTGWPEASDELVVRGSIEARDFSAFFLRDHRMVGAITIGRAADIRTARKIIGAGTTPDVAMLADESIPVAETVTTEGASV